MNVYLSMHTYFNENDVDFYLYLVKFILSHKYGFK